MPISKRPRQSTVLVIRFSWWKWRWEAYNTIFRYVFQQARTKSALLRTLAEHFGAVATVHLQAAEVYDMRYQKTRHSEHHMNESFETSAAVKAASDACHFANLLIDRERGLPFNPYR